MPNGAAGQAERMAMRLEMVRRINEAGDRTRLILVSESPEEVGGILIHMGPGPENRPHAAVLAQAATMLLEHTGGSK
jgi:hypothetical protein